MSLTHSPPSLVRNFTRLTAPDRQVRRLLFNNLRAWRRDAWRTTLKERPRNTRIWCSQQAEGGHSLYYGDIAHAQLLH